MPGVCLSFCPLDLDARLVTVGELSPQRSCEQGRKGREAAPQIPPGLNRPCLLLEKMIWHRSGAIFDTVEMHPSPPREIV